MLTFADLTIKGRALRGNIVTKNTIKIFELKGKRIVYIKTKKIWFDDTVQRLNVAPRDLLVSLGSEDKILVVSQTGILKIISPELTTHFNEDMIILEKWIQKPLSVVYFDSKKEKVFCQKIYY